MTQECYYEDLRCICVKYSVSVPLKRIHLKEKLLSAAREFRPCERPIFVKSRRFQAYSATVTALREDVEGRRTGGWPARDGSTRGRVAATGGW